MPDIEYLRSQVKEQMVSRLRVLRLSADQFLDERTVTNRTDADRLELLDDEIDDDLSEEERLLALQEVLRKQNLLLSNFAT